ncbi:MAG: type VI secretion system contractile sheath large subunit [Pikeienuella sp.]|uniref:type VI secretion system contractile sheath large subunit n=1 Tax=Pikeienuella sp. TaxID=2831957 RepID=UPI003919D2CF
MAETEPTKNDEDDANPTLLDQIIREGRIARADAGEELQTYARNLVQEFVSKVMEKTPPPNRSLVEYITTIIADMDEQIEKQLNAVLHHKAFQEAEATWRGLHYLVFKAETGTRLKIRVLNVSQMELTDDLDKAIEFDQSALFKKVYEEEYGTFGGAPYSMLVGDISFGRSTEDFVLLEKMAEVAAAAHAPFVAAAAPELFDMESHRELPLPRDLSKIFESAELIKWRSFRKSEDSRYVALALPRVLMRLPYGPDNGMQKVEGIAFREDVSNPNTLETHSKFLWGNPAFVLAERIAMAFSLHGWTAAIRGVEGGGKVEGLPTHTFKTMNGDAALKCPTETPITDRREKELDELGFITLMHCKNTDYAAFFGGRTTNEPITYNTNQANANARLSAMLPYMLNASRFAHYVKVIMRDKIGSFMTEDNVRDYLTTWISDYVLGKDDAGQSIKAKYPLREARVDVRPIPGRPGAYSAVLFLRPHFQLEELSTSIRLVAELPAPAA